jgi:hypothetical protein
VLVTNSEVVIRSTDDDIVNIGKSYDIDNIPLVIREERLLFFLRPRSVIVTYFCSNRAHRSNLQTVHAKFGDNGALRSVPGDQVEVGENSVRVVGQVHRIIREMQSRERDTFA